MWLLPVRLGIGLLVVGVAACAAVRTQDSAKQEKAPPPDVRRDIPYGGAGGEDSLRRYLDVHRPVADGPLPAVILVHGGSWARGGRHRMERVAERAVERGYVAVNIEYRLAPDHRHPTQLADVLDAVCWVRAHAEEFGIDPERIALWGYSAGAHLSLLAAARPDLAAAGERCAQVPATVQACVAGAGPTDLRLLGAAGPVRDFLGGSPAEILPVYEEASPLLAADGDHPPTFLYHGRSDWIVDVEHSRQMHDALEAAGVTVELLETDDGHITAARIAELPIDRGFDFLDRHLRGA